MSTSPNAPSASMAFPRYPELPPELRLKIIEETFESLSRFGQRSRLSPFACIDREWNRVVELRTFKDIKLCPQIWYHTWTSSAIEQELIDFGAICGKRSGRLSRISLTFHDIDHLPSDNHPQIQTLLQLFDLMKDWNCRGRDQQGLIELRLDFGPMRNYGSRRPEYPYDLSKFPQVPVIGGIYETQPGTHGVRVHPCITVALLQKLPSIHRASLTLPSGPSEYVSTEDFIDAMDSLRLNKPGLTHLELRVDSTQVWRHGFGPTQLPIIQSLNESPSPWSDRLVSLKVQQNIVIEDFLRDASKIIWPNLKVLKLVEAVDLEDQDNGTHADEIDAYYAAAEESGNAIIEALITALPSMPKATDFQFRVICRRFDKGFQIFIHLGNLARTQGTAKILPCSDSFVPNSNNGVARVTGIYLPGGATVQLQDAVRCHRRQELEVFACGAGWSYDRRKPDGQCAHWNRRTEDWDRVFWNDMDLFIYEMGQYWEAVD